MSNQQVVRMMAILLGITMLLPVSAFSADYSKTEFNLQLGRFKDPFGTLGGNPGGNTEVVQYGFEHFSTWRFGENFYFVDVVSGSAGEVDIYGEWYSTFSLGKILDKDLSVGPLRDLGLIAGFNFGADPDILIYLPGVRLAWDIPGFVFLNTDFMAYITDFGGTRSEGAPKEDDSWMIDLNFATPQVELGPTKWNLEGHMEWIDSRDNEFGEQVRDWYLSQIQLRMDLGEHIGLGPNTLFAGLEWQLWLNKLGSDQDENTLNALAVWRF